MDDFDDRLIDLGKAVKLIPAFFAGIAIAAIIPWLIFPNQQDARWAIGIAAFVIYPITFAALLLLSGFLIRKGLAKRNSLPLVVPYWTIFGIFAVAALYACSELITT